MRYCGGTAALGCGVGTGVAVVVGTLVGAGVVPADVCRLGTGSEGSLALELVACGCVTLSLILFEVEGAEAATAFAFEVRANWGGRSAMNAWNLF